MGRPTLDHETLLAAKVALSSLSEFEVAAIIKKVVKSTNGSDDRKRHLAKYIRCAFDMTKEYENDEPSTDDLPHVSALREILSSFPPVTLQNVIEWSIVQMRVRSNMRTWCQENIVLSFTYLLAKE